LKEAFQASCVPAFQILAHNIGKERMEKWIANLNFGDKDISSGIDDFWLPSEGKKSIEISPIEQAELIRKLVNKELPFSDESQRILKEVMINSKTSKGVCYGKTGSSKANYKGIKNQSIGWFVGYITNNDRAYSFSCLIQGENVSGKDSKGS
jgi:beta-lactamase class D